MNKLEINYTQQHKLITLLSLIIYEDFNFIIIEKKNLSRRKEKQLFFHLADVYVYGRL